MINISSNLSAADIAKAQSFLSGIRPILATNDCKFEVSEKNREFDKRYPLKHEQKVDIIKGLSADDCIKIGPNDNKRYTDAEIYTFTKDVIIPAYGYDEEVRLYIKMYRLPEKTYDLVVVISFHEEGLYI